MCAIAMFSILEQFKLLTVLTVQYKLRIEKKTLLTELTSLRLFKKWKKSKPHCYFLIEAVKINKMDVCCKSGCFLVSVYMEQV